MDKDVQLKGQEINFSTQKLEYDSIKIYCPFHRDQLITLVCIENDCNEKLMCPKCQLYNNTNKHEMISIQKFAQVIRNYEHINMFDADQQLVFEGKSLKAKLSYFMKGADEARDKLMEMDLKAIEEIMNNCLQQMISSFSLLKEKIKNSYMKKIDEVISQEALHNFEFKLKALQKIYKLMKESDYSETNAQIIHLHQGGFELDYSLEKNNKIFGDFRNKVEIFSVDILRIFKTQVDEFSKVFSDFEKRNQTKFSNVARSIMNQQKFIQEAKLSTMKLPNLVSQKSSSQNSLLQSHSQDNKLKSRASFNNLTGQILKTEPIENQQDEVIEKNNQIIKGRNSTQLMAKRSSAILNQVTPSANSLNDLGSLNVQNHETEQTKQEVAKLTFESPKSIIGINKALSKSLAQELISPLKSFTPSRYNSQFQKIDQSLSEFLDFNQTIIANKEKKKTRDIKNLNEHTNTPKHANDQHIVDTSKTVIHDLILMGKDLFAAGTNNGGVQIWKYKDFSFSCIFQIQAHYSPVQVASTNVSGIIFSYGLNVKGQNSVKIWNNDTESSLTEIIEILELHPNKSTMLHLFSLAEIFKGSQNNIIFATYGNDDFSQIKVWDFAFDNKNFNSTSKNQIKQKQIISTENIQLDIIKQDFDKSIFIGCSKNQVIFWKYYYNKESQRLDIQKLQSYTFKINLEENGIVDVEFGKNNVYVSTRLGQITLLELNGVFIKNIQFFTKYLKQTQKEDVNDLVLRKVLYYTIPEKIIIICQKNDTHSIIPFLFNKVEAQHEIMTEIKIQYPLKLVLPINEMQFITLEKNNILKQYYL
ncbi:hypothetical protein ABPG74_004640 [Tetrahymena malaccensis]